MDRPNSDQLPRRWPYLGDISGGSRSFAYGAITLCGGTFQNASARADLCNSRPPPRGENRCSHDPGHATVAALHVTGLGSFHFARRYSGSRFAFLSCRYLDVSVPCVGLRRLCIQHRMTEHYLRRVSPFGHPRIKARLAAPRGLSQLAAPFIASWRQGIHHEPFIA